MNELIDIIKQQQQQLTESQKMMEKVIEETIPKIGNNNNNNSNNKISINVYLNKNCKDAMNLTDFVEQINVSIEDLLYTTQHGHAEGLANIFQKQLKDMNPTDRPIHCSDKKRLQFYVKDDDTWHKDEKHIKIDKTIHDIRMKQVKNLKKWEDMHPAYLTNENNADMLLAGYNTMSKQEKEDFDLKNYLVFFKKFFINLAIYSSLIFLIFYTAFDESTASIAYFISVLLPMPYMIYKGNKFKTKKK